MMPLYFAYGSNMDRAAMAKRCPGAWVIGLARLERHRLVLMREGYLSIVRDPRRAVHGLLWELPLADIPALDRYEGVSSGLYVKKQQPVVSDAGIRKALIYFGTNASPGVPVPGYLEGVLAAAGEVGLPPSALAELAALGGGRGGPATRPAPVAATRTGPVPAVRPTRTSPLEAPRPETKPGWSWSP